MNVFVTGATGFVGSAVIQELILAGHIVTGLSRSEEGAKALVAAGAKVHSGDLRNLESLRSGATASDGVIHCGFIHDFSNFEASCEVDKRAIEVLAATLANSDRPLIVTSGTTFLATGKVATEKDVRPADSKMPRVSEETALSVPGVRALAIRLPPTVHGDGDHAFIPMLIKLAREKGVSAYIGEGQNRWSAVHRLDAASLYKLALEKGAPGVRYHGVSEEGIAFRDIAEAIGKQLKVPVVSKTPEEAAEHFGWFAMFAAIDAPASNQWTREQLGWNPVQTTLIKDLEYGTYFQK